MCRAKRATSSAAIWPRGGDPAQPHQRADAQPPGLVAEIDGVHPPLVFRRHRRLVAQKPQRSTRPHSPSNHVAPALEFVAEEIEHRAHARRAQRVLGAPPARASPSSSPATSPTLRNSRLGGADIGTAAAPRRRPRAASSAISDDAARLAPPAATARHGDRSSAAPAAGPNCSARHAPRRASGRASLARRHQSRRRVNPPGRDGATQRPVRSRTAAAVSGSAKRCPPAPCDRSSAASHEQRFRHAGRDGRRASAARIDGSTSMPIEVDRRQPHPARDAAPRCRRRGARTRRWCRPSGSPARPCPRPRPSGGSRSVRARTI